MLWTRPGGRSRAAALFGRRFDPELVAALVERPVDEVLSVLRRCLGLQLLSVDGAGFQFRHELTRDAVLAGLTPGLRSVLARRACAGVGQVRDGKIIELTEYWNMAEFLTQVGAMPPPGP
jgi:hypothetical protein